MVKPEGAGEAPRDLPSLVDLQEFADVQSYVDHSAGQSRMLQLAASANLDVPPPAVFVSILSFSGALLAGVRPPRPLFFTTFIDHASMCC